MSQVLKAIADPTRRRVLELLRRAPMSAGELADHFDVSRPTMSTHFKVLKEADLVHAEKQGTTIIYSLKMSVLEEALAALAQAFRLDLPADAGPGIAAPEGAEPKDATTKTTSTSNKEDNP